MNLKRFWTTFRIAHFAGFHQNLDRSIFVARLAGAFVQQ